MAQTSFHACYHCKDRAIGCHSTCKLYAEEKKENEQRRFERVKENDIDATINANIRHRRSTRNRNYKKFSNTGCPFC